MVDRAHAWHTAGQYFTWYPEGSSGAALQIFYRCLGDPMSPAIVLLHGAPTSSYDFHLLASDLSTDHYVCLLDFPGYGFSDKPRTGYAYSLRNDARLVDYFVQQTVRLQHFALLTHDRGDSVGLALLADFPAYRHQTSPLTHHVLTNGNIYLPLANLTDWQKALRDPRTSQTTAAAFTASQLASFLGHLAFTPPLSPDDPETAALANILAYASGLEVLPLTIKYLDERAQAEVSWLESLHESGIPTTLIWGLHDTVSSIRVANYVWETSLRSRAAQSAYWVLPGANHYLQHDQPAALAHLVRLSLSDQILTAPMNLTSDPSAPVLVERGGLPMRGALRETGMLAPHA